MCGIYGCIGDNAAKQVLDGLRKLEYRGYDSAGLAAIFSNTDEPIETERTTGFVADLVTKANGRFDGAIVSIGHTRWATHGGVSDTNAHPHSSIDGKITVVHNGIIENATYLSRKLSKLGYDLNSETDTEVIVHLLDHQLKIEPDGVSYLEAFSNVISQLQGSWAIAVMISGLEGILISRNGAPLVVGKGISQISIASDIQPLYGSCSEIAYLNDGDNFLVSSTGIHSMDDLSTPDFSPLSGIYDEADPGEFEHMMLKEIHDQPKSVTNAISGRIGSDGFSASLGGFSLSPEEILQLDRINLVGCGTAFFAAEIIASYLRNLTEIQAHAYISSEFPSHSVCSPRTLTIGISQSGETKDTLDALLDAKKNGSHIAALCNVIGSTISRLTGNGAYLHAGTEYAVASTKVFSNMVATGLLFSLSLSNLSSNKKKKIISDLRKIPNTLLRQLISDDGSIGKAATLIHNSEPPIFIGRSYSSIVAKEGALKMTEVSYIPCISLPSGELKHGAIALISPGTPIIAIAPSDEKLNLMETSIRECKSRGAKIILISDSEGPISELADILIQTHFVHPVLSPLSSIVPIQLLAYRVAILRKSNVDRPRNLAKSVTVV